MRAKLKTTQSEHQLQKQCVAWFRLQYPKLANDLFTVPNGASLNGTKLQRAKQWKRLQAEGAVKGVSDLLLLIPSGEFHALCIEIKTTAKHSKQSEYQKAFEERVLSRGYGYVIPRTFDEFRKVVTNYLEKGEY
jgi:hypothetical protein